MSTLNRRLAALEAAQGRGTVAVLDTGDPYATVNGTGEHVTPEHFRRVYPLGILIVIVEDAP